MIQLNSCLILQKELGDSTEGTITYIREPKDDTFLVWIEGTFDEGLFQMNHMEVVDDIYIYKNLKGWQVCEVNDLGQTLVDEADKRVVLGGQ